MRTAEAVSSSTMLLWYDRCHHTGGSLTTLLTGHIWKHDASTSQHGNPVVIFFSCVHSVLSLQSIHSHGVKAIEAPIFARSRRKLAILSASDLASKASPTKACPSCKALRQSRHTTFCRHSAAHLVLQTGSALLDTTMSRGTHHSPMLSRHTIAWTVA